MLKSIATTLLNRLVFLVAIVFVVNAYTRNGCGSAENPFTQIGKIVTGLNEIATVFQKR